MIVIPDPTENITDRVNEGANSNRKLLNADEMPRSGASKKSASKAGSIVRSPRGNQLNRDKKVFEMAGLIR